MTVIFKSICSIDRSVDFLFLFCWSVRLILDQSLSLFLSNLLSPVDLSFVQSFQSAVFPISLLKSLFIPQRSFDHFSLSSRSLAMEQSSSILGDDLRSIVSPGSDLPINGWNHRSKQCFGTFPRLSSGWSSSNSLVDDDQVRSSLSLSSLHLVRFSSLLKSKSPRDDRFYLFNRHDQLNLYSSSSSLKNVSGLEWKIFEGLSNGSWSLLEGLSSYLAGQTEKNLTISREFFESYPLVQSWRFQVISSSNESSEFFVEMNDPPRNGSCSISPATGDLLSEFSLVCRDWFDENGIQDYLLLARFSSTLDDRLILSSSLNGSFRTSLPFTLNRSEELFLSVIIRDEWHSATEYSQIPPMKIVMDIERFFDLPSSWPVPTFLRLIEQIEEEFLYEISQRQSLSHWTVAPLDDRSPRTLVRNGFSFTESDALFF